MTLRIAYLSWPATEITGGIKMVFRHVEVLREAGLDAVVATPGAEPPGWMKTTAPLVHLSKLEEGRDVLVFPENHHEMLKTFAPWRNRKVVFCQNPFMVIRGLGGARDYAEFGVGGILCAGRYVADYCQLRFPSLPLAIVPVYVDHELFRFQGSPNQKKLQIAYTPRKRPFEMAVIRDLCLARHPEFHAIPWIKINGVSEAQVAATLNETAVYLALCRFEASGLTILEAMASGCVVAGFTGQGGRQYTHARNGFWTEEDDCFACAEALAQAVRLATEGGPRYRDVLEAALDSTRPYSRPRMAKGLVEFWEAFLKGTSFPRLTI